MKELYFIELLANLNTTLAIFMAVSACIIIISLIVIICEGGEYADDKLLDSSKKWLKRAVLIFIPSLLVSMFIPSRNSMYVIYGIGSTIDYIKSNDTTKQLPDKVIQVLDKWLDDQKEEWQ